MGGVLLLVNPLCATKPYAVATKQLGSGLRSLRTVRNVENPEHLKLRIST